MRCCCVLILALLVFPGLTSCDYVFAEPVTKRWISYGNIGVEITKRADRYSGKLHWLSTDGQRFRHRSAFSNGLFDDQKGTLVFDLALKRGSSLKALREGDAQYVEIEIDFDSDELVGKWRKGTNPPFDVHSFYPYEEE